MFYAFTHKIKITFYIISKLYIWSIYFWNLTCFFVKLRLIYNIFYILIIFENLSVKYHFFLNEEIRLFFLIIHIFFFLDRLLMFSNWFQWISLLYYLFRLKSICYYLSWILFFYGNFRFRILIFIICWFFIKINRPLI